MIVNRLKSLRGATKISQKDFAQALKVSQQTVASWERGRTEPSNGALKEIADYFNVSTDYLLGRETEAPTLSEEQRELLRIFESLSSAGQRDMLGYMDFLRYKYGSSAAVKPTQNNFNTSGDIKNNFVAYGGHNSVKQNVTMN